LFGHWSAVTKIFVNKNILIYTYVHDIHFKYFGKLKIQMSGKFSFNFLQHGNGMLDHMIGNEIVTAD